MPIPAPFRLSIFAVQSAALFFLLLSLQSAQMSFAADMPYTPKAATAPRGEIKEQTAAPKPGTTATTVYKAPAISNKIPSSATLPVTLPLAIQRYREKNYPEADKLLTQLHHDALENTKITYYLAITKAQEGEYAEAARLYQEVFRLEPNTPLGLLSQEGLRNLPLTTTAQVDAPPQFHETSTGVSSSFTTPSTNDVTGASTPGVSQSDWLWMQSMMGNNNGNNNNNDPWGALSGMNGNMGGSNSGNGMNFMPPGVTMTPQGGMVQSTGKPIDPQVMSAWLTNQMMQNSTQFMSPSNNDDR
jgi:tetratricopeptide (TPR) repeat protein